MIRTLPLYLLAGFALVIFGCDDDSDGGETDGGAGDGGGGECAAGETLCGEACVNTRENEANCGECGNACQPGGQCVDGNCVLSTDEICDGQDNDVDNKTDEGPDGQPLTRDCSNLCGDGVQTCAGGTFGECSAPSPTDEACDGEDNDCDGKTDEGVDTLFFRDGDDDGFGDPSAANARRACEAPDGFVDDDTDCDDGADMVNPMADEACDGVDNNCNEDVDEGCDCAPLGDTRDCGTDEGICGVGEQTCGDEGWSECAGPDFVAPENEACSGADEDCDGAVDEELADDPYEANDECADARPLPQVDEDSTQSIDDAALYQGDPDGDFDVDWYTIEANEGFGLCTPGFRECGFALVATLTVPETASVDDFVLCVNEAEACGEEVQTACTDGEAGVIDAEAGTIAVELLWDGRCGLDNSREFRVEVSSPTDLNACSPYTLDFGFTYRDLDCPE